MTSGFRPSGSSEYWFWADEPEEMGCLSHWGDPGPAWRSRCIEIAGARGLEPTYHSYEWDGQVVGWFRLRDPAFASKRGWLHDRRMSAVNARVTARNVLRLALEDAGLWSPAMHVPCSPLPCECEEVWTS